MSNYTITLQEYVNTQALLTYTGNTPAMYLETLTPVLIHTYGRKLFPDEFPIYNTEEKYNFMDAFVDHFYFHEIGSETIGQFKWCLRDFLNLRMPYYTDMYNSRISDLASIYPTDYTRTRTENGSDKRSTTRSGTGSDITDTTRTGTTSNTANGENTAYVFPINNSGTASAQSKTSADTDTTGTASETGKDTRSTSNSETGSDDLTINRTESETVKGFNGVNRVEYVRAYRDLIFSINDLIFDDMEKRGLFLKLWL